MGQNNETELKNIKKKIVRIQIIGVPAAILIGLGLYGIFGANGNAFHPVLNDRKVIYSMLVVGVILEIWQFSILMPLFKKQAGIVREKKT